jgi:hypothetical protein
VRTAALLLNPVLADGARVVLAPAPRHRTNGPVDEEGASDSDGSKSKPEHEGIFADCASARNLTSQEKGRTSLLLMRA